MKSKLSAIFFAGLTAGVLDAIAAVIVFKVSMGRMFQFIASGIVGPGQAFTGGASTIALGIACHFLISFAWAALFFLLAPKVYSFSRNRVLHAIIFGIIIWCVMNLLILPLSNTPKTSISVNGAATGIMILIFAVGLPISFSAAQFYRSTRTT